MKEDMIKSFDRIALLDDKWDHNRSYAKLLLGEINTPDGESLEAYFPKNKAEEIIVLEICFNIHKIRYGKESVLI